MAQHNEIYSITALIPGVSERWMTALVIIAHRSNKMHMEMNAFKILKDMNHI